MWDKIKGVTAVAIGIAVLFVGALLIALFIHGGAWLAGKIYPWLVTVSTIALAVVIFILLPLVLFQKTRGFSAAGLMIAAFVFGFTLEVWSLLLTYHLWGAIAVYIGIFFFGVGVMPIAMLATVFKGMWSTFGELVLLTVLTFGTGFAGTWAAAKAEEY